MSDGAKCQRRDVKIAGLVRATCIDFHALSKSGLVCATCSYEGTPSEVPTKRH